MYILYSECLDRYYIGYSENPVSRLNKHLSRHDGFTSRAKDWRVVYQEAFTDKSKALKREGN